MKPDSPIGFMQPDGGVISLENGKLFAPTEFRGLIFYDSHVSPRTIEQCYPWHTASRGRNRKPGYTGPLGSVRHVSAWGTDDVLKAADRARAAALISKELHGSAAAFSRTLMPKSLHMSDYRHSKKDDTVVQGIHQGPCVLTRASAPEAIYLDRKGAFLECMKEQLPLPQYGPVRCVPKVSEVLDPAWKGTVCAVCWVPFSWVPPLPTRTENSRFRICQPWGVVAGVWSADILRTAVECYGVQVKRIIVGWKAWKVDRWMVPLAERINRIEHPGLRKVAYLTAWGGLASEGFLSGAREHTKGAAIFADSSLYWSHSSRNGPDYRPDIAAMFTGYNFSAMIRHAQKAGDRVLMMHVDSLVIQGTPVERLESYGMPVKGVGAFRAWGGGNYEIDGPIPASGNSGLEPSISLEEHRSRLEERGRQWIGGEKPSLSANAVSMPFFEKDACAPRPPSEAVVKRVHAREVPLPPSSGVVPVRDRWQLPDPGDAWVWIPGRAMVPGKIGIHGVSLLDGTPIPKDACFTPTGTMAWCRYAC